MTAGGDPLVALAGVGMTFGSTVALAGVDLAVSEGEFVSLLGPSGCGKTTLLRLVAGLDAPTAGRVGGRPLGPGDEGLAVVFQDPTLLPWSDVFDNVWLPLRLAGLSRREAAGRILPLLEMVGLSGFERTWPHALSGGMRMRVALARALVTRPRLLLMDEPFAALDEITRFRLNDDLLRLVAELRCTVLFVTHSVYESVYLSTRLAVMSPRPGRIVADIPVDLPGPRHAALRRDVRYLDVCRQASDALDRSAAAAPGTAA